MKKRLYRWIHSEFGILYDIGIYQDGTLRNSRG